MQDLEPCLFPLQILYGTWHLNYMSAKQLSVSHLLFLRKAEIELNQSGCDKQSSQPGRICCQCFDWDGESLGWGTGKLSAWVVAWLPCLPMAFSCQYSLLTLAPSKTCAKCIPVHPHFYLRENCTGPQRSGELLCCRLQRQSVASRECGRQAPSEEKQGLGLTELLSHVAGMLGEGEASTWKPCAVTCGLVLTVWLVSLCTAVC